MRLHRFALPILLLVLLCSLRPVAQAQTSGAAAPPVLRKDDDATKLSLALPVEASSKHPRVVRQPRASREDIIVLSESDLSGVRLGALIEAFRARQRATSERARAAETIELQADSYVQTVTGARVERVERLLQKLKTAPIDSVAGVGRARVIDIILPSLTLEAKLRKSP